MAGRTSLALGIALIALSLLPAVLLPLSSSGAALAFLSDPLRGLWASGVASERPLGEVELEGLRGRVVVVWDRYGVPHIYGEHERDVFQVFGYIQACDRLWQMDFQRRIVYGRLSELLGEEAYGVDRYMRMLGLGEAAKRSWELIKRLASEGDEAARRT
ncbi:MAG: penicillin acylase family protein, partial [Thermoproteota archaeon]